MDLEYFSCYNSEITELPEISNSVKDLNCSHNKIEQILHLPEDLEELNCSYNELTKLPKLPTNLKILFCDNNQITELPDDLPNLQKIYCGDNRITKLPENLPESLKELHCSNNLLTSLPKKLPPTLKIITCQHNKITNLNTTDFPASLMWLVCHANNIKEIPFKLLVFKCEISCGNYSEVLDVSAKNLLKRNINRIKWKKFFLQWILCKKLINKNLNHCSYLIAQY